MPQQDGLPFQPRNLEAAFHKKKYNGSSESGGNKPKRGMSVQPAKANGNSEKEKGRGKHRRNNSMKPAAAKTTPSNEKESEINSNWYSKHNVKVFSFESDSSHKVSVSPPMLLSELKVSAYHLYSIAVQNKAVSSIESQLCSLLEASKDCVAVSEHKSSTIDYILPVLRHIDICKQRFESSADYETSRHDVVILTRDPQRTVELEQIFEQYLGLEIDHYRCMYVNEDNNIPISRNADFDRRNRIRILIITPHSLANVGIKKFDMDLTHVTLVVLDRVDQMTQCREDVTVCLKACAQNRTVLLTCPGYTQQIADMQLRFCRRPVVVTAGANEASSVTAYASNKKVCVFTLKPETPGGSRLSSTTASPRPKKLRPNDVFLASIAESSSSSDATVPVVCTAVASFIEDDDYAPSAAELRGRLEGIAGDSASGISVDENSLVLLDETAASHGGDGDGWLAIDDSGHEAALGALQIDDELGGGGGGQSSGDVVCSPDTVPVVLRRGRSSASSQQSLPEMGHVVKIDKENENMTVKQYLLQGGLSTPGPVIDVNKKPASSGRRKQENPRALSIMPMPSASQKAATPKRSTSVRAKPQQQQQQQHPPAIRVGGGGGDDCSDADLAEAKRLVNMYTHAVRFQYYDTDDDRLKMLHKRLMELYKVYKHRTADHTIVVYTSTDWLAKKVFSKANSVLYGKTANVSMALDDASAEQLKSKKNDDRVRLWILNDRVTVPVVDEHDSHVYVFHLGFPAVWKNLFTRCGMFDGSRLKLATSCILLLNNDNYPRRLVDAIESKQPTMAATSLLRK